MYSEVKTKADSRRVFGCDNEPRLIAINEFLCLGNDKLPCTPPCKLSQHKKGTKTENIHLKRFSSKGKDNLEKSSSKIPQKRHFRGRNEAVCENFEHRLEQSSRQFANLHYNII
jgi:hypothetical protein